MNILLTGRPRTGKTTIIRKFARRCPVPVGGFLTSEIREHGMRAGFAIDALRLRDQETREDSGEKYHAVMAHTNYRSPYRVGRYGVNTAAIETVGVADLRKAVRSAHLIIIDEIGRMEPYCEPFKKEVNTVLDCPIPVPGVIQMNSNPFPDGIRNRGDVTVIEVTLENRDILPERLLESFGMEM